MTMLNTAICSANNDDLLTTSPAARFLEVSDNSLRGWADKGRVPCLRLANGIRVFRRTDLEQLRTARAGGR